MQTDVKKSDVAEINELLKSDLMKEFRDKKAAESLAERLAVAEKIEALKIERDTDVPKLQNELAEKESAYWTVKAAMDSAAAEYNSLKSALAAKVHSYEAAKGRLENILYETASPELDEAISFFQSKLDWLRKPGRLSTNFISSENNIFTMKTTIEQETNAPAVNAALQYCMAVIRELGKMKLSPAIDRDLIERMKAAIPDISVYSDASSDKNMARGPADPLHPLTLLAQENESNFRLGKLDEKFKKLMKK